MAKIDRFAEAALRQKIIDALKIDLIGPVEPNEVMDQDPASEYLTGMIYAKSLADDLEFGEQEVGFDFAHEDDYSTGAYLIRILLHRWPGYFQLIWKKALKTTH